MPMSKINTFKTINTHNNRVLANYQRQIKQQQHLLNFIKQLLPTPLAEHVLYCTIFVKKLLIYTDSATWSSQLRFYQKTMLEAVINAELAQVETIKIKLIAQHKPPKNESVINMPSEDNIKLLRNCGEQTEDEKLKQALLNLSNTLDKLSS